MPSLYSHILYPLNIPGVFTECPRPPVASVCKSTSHSLKRFALEGFDRRPQIIAVCTWSIKSNLHKRSWAWD